MPIELYFKNRGLSFFEKKAPYQILTARESLQTYLISGACFQLLAAQAYYLTRNKSIVKRFFRGSTMFISLVVSAYTFSKMDINKSKEAKITAYFATHTFWGATICHFIIKFLPQVKLGLILPLATCSFASYAISVSMTFRRGKSDKPAALYYSNETLCAIGILATQLGLMSGFGLILLNKRFKLKKDDWK